MVAGAGAHPLHEAGAAQGTPGERCSRFRCARPISEPACSQPLSTRDIGRTASVRSLVRPSRAFRVVVPRCCSCALCCWGLPFRPCAGGATFLLGQARASVDAHLTSPKPQTPNPNPNAMRASPCRESGRPRAGPGAPAKQPAVGFRV